MCKWVSVYTGKFPCSPPGAKQVFCNEDAQKVWKVLRRVERQRGLVAEAVGIAAFREVSSSLALKLCWRLSSKYSLVTGQQLGWTGELGASLPRHHWRWKPACRDPASSVADLQSRFYDHCTLISSCTQLYATCSQPAMLARGVLVGQNNLYVSLHHFCSHKRCEGLQEPSRRFLWPLPPPLFSLSPE